MRKFDNQIQKIKNEVLAEVSRLAFEGILEEEKDLIPVRVNPGPEERYRCCIYHERAITADRAYMAMGGDGDSSKVIEVLDSACDQCPVHRYTITEACRGCLANRCMTACPVDAITKVDGKAKIDHNKCIECGRCKQACPYNAVADVMRPCRRDCPTNAIQIDHRKKAVIDYDKCINCGACVYHCPFGAISDKSEITQVIEALKEEDNHVYAMLAPAFATQFEYADLGQVVHGLKVLGFKDVVEVALGADLVTIHEAEELEKMKIQEKTMTSSCCPAFVEYIHKTFPDLTSHISTTVSPMIATARLVKAIDPKAITVFVGPCIAKKKEKLKSKDTDFVLTFEELAAMLDSQHIDFEALEVQPLDNASYYGRRFAASGGVALSVETHLKERGVTGIQIEVCDGVKECDKALKLLKFNRLNKDFIEGMACKGGCIKGPVTMHHGPKDIKSLENHAKTAKEQSTTEAVQVFSNVEISLEL